MYNVKEKFELVYGKTSSVYNVAPVTKHTLVGYEVSDEDKHHLMMLSLAYARSRSGKDFVSEYMKNVMVVRIPTYPLPGFVTKDSVPVINLSVLPSEFISDYSSSDIYAMYLYSIALAKFIKHMPFEDQISDHIAEYYSHTFMKLFGKKHGLTGSYKHLIRYMQALISLYVNVSLMGKPQTTSLVNKISNKYYIAAESLDLSEDFSTTLGFLRSINRNNIIPLSENKFSTTIINISGVSSLPMFEDVSRFFATIMAANISGSTVYSHYWKKINIKLYDKLNYMAELNYNRVKL